MANASLSNQVALEMTTPGNNLRCHWLLLLSWSVSLPCLGGATALADRPNLVIIIADDMAWDDCGAYGHPAIRTPHIDRLATEGLRFANAFLTCSSCSPSRSSINTGRYPHSTGAAELHQPLPADQRLFASALRAAGYYTAACGKWHLGDAVKEQFDLVLSGGDPAGYGHWISVLQQRPSDRPFFLWLATTDPHRPYQDRTIADPHGPAEVQVPPYLPDADAVRADLASYYDEIGRLDDWVGKIMAELTAQGIADNTLVLFLSDNGRPFPRCKTTLLDSGIRTPFIVHWPARVAAGGVTDSLVSAVDIAPTFCELAGAEVLPSFQGVSFAPILRDPKASVRERVFAEHHWHDYMAWERAVRTPRFLYIFNALPELPLTPPADAVRSPTYALMRQRWQRGELNEAQRYCFEAPSPSEQLYDVLADPHQLANLADKPAYARQLAALRGQLAAWQQRTGDRLPPRSELTPDRFDRTQGTPTSPR